MLTATCHCGAVRLEITRKPQKLTQCNCSICRRYGATWAYYSKKSVDVICKCSALAGYTWGDKNIEVFHCTSCGCITHYEFTKRSADGSHRLAVNARNLDDTDLLARLPIRTLDGASTWKVLEECAQPNLFRSPE